MKDRFGEQLYDSSCTCVRCVQMRPPRPHPRLRDLPYGEEVCVACGADKDPHVQGDWCSRCIRDQEEAMR